MFYIDQKRLDELDSVQKRRVRARKIAFTSVEKLAEAILIANILLGQNTRTEQDHQIINSALKVLPTVIEYAKLATTAYSEINDELSILFSDLAKANKLEDTSIDKLFIYNSSEKVKLDTNPESITRKAHAQKILDSLQDNLEIENLTNPMTLKVRIKTAEADLTTLINDPKLKATPISKTKPIQDIDILKGHKALEKLIQDFKDKRYGTNSPLGVESDSDTLSLSIDTEQFSNPDNPTPLSDTETLTLATQVTIKNENEDVPEAANFEFQEDPDDIGSAGSINDDSSDQELNDRSVSDDSSTGEGSIASYQEVEDADDKIGQPILDLSQKMQLIITRHKNTNEYEKEQLSGIQHILDEKPCLRRYTDKQLDLLKNDKLAAFLKAHLVKTKAVFNEIKNILKPKIDLNQKERSRLDKDRIALQQVSKDLVERLKKINAKGQWLGSQYCLKAKLDEIEDYTNKLDENLYNKKRLSDITSLNERKKLFEDALKRIPLLIFSLPLDDTQVLPDAQQAFHLNQPRLEHLREQLTKIKEKLILSIEEIKQIESDIRVNLQHAGRASEQWSNANVLPGHRRITISPPTELASSNINTPSSMFAHTYSEIHASTGLSFKLITNKGKAKPLMYHIKNQNTFVYDPENDESQYRSYHKTIDKYQDQKATIEAGLRSMKYAGNLEHTRYEVDSANTILQRKACVWLCTLDKVPLIKNNKGAWIEFQPTAIETLEIQTKKFKLRASELKSKLQTFTAQLRP